MSEAELWREIKRLQSIVDVLQSKEVARYPACRVYHSVAQSIANDTATPLAFDSERYDTDNMHDTVTNNSRIYTPYDGRVLIAATIQFAPNATGYRQLFTLVEGSLITSVMTIPAVTTASIQTDLNLVSIGNFSAGSYFQIYARQNSGGALNINAIPNYTAEVVAAYIGRKV